MEERGIKGDVITEMIREALDRMPRGSGVRIAKQIGVSPQAVSSWRHGKTIPDMETWPKIEEALGMEPGIIRARAFTPSESQSAVYQELLERMERLESLVRHALLGQPPESRAGE